MAIVMYCLQIPSIGKVGEEEAIICSHYHEVQAPLWVKLTEERLRIIRAKQTYTGRPNNNIIMETVALTNWFLLRVYSKRALVKMG